MKSKKSGIEYRKHGEDMHELHLPLVMLTSRQLQKRIDCGVSPDQEFRREGWTETAIILCKLNKSL